VGNKPSRLNSEQRIELMLKAGLRPLVPYQSAITKWECECLSCGSIVSPMYNTIQQGHGGCRSCGASKGGKARRKSIEDLEDKLSKIGLKLIEINEERNQPLVVKCISCGEIQRIGQDAIRLRINKGCTKCVRRVVSSQQVSKDQAEEEMRAKGLQPLEQYVGYKTPWKNQCLVCKEEVLITRESVRRRSLDIKGCKDCAKVAQNNAHVEKKKAEVLKRFELLNLTLLSEYLGAKKPILVKCNRCSYEFTTNGSRLIDKKFGCGRCAGNDIDPEDVFKFLNQLRFEPLEPYVSNKKPLKCRHLDCGNIVEVLLPTIKRTGGGCKFCAKHGFQYSKPAYLYLIRSESLNAVKIGIANPSRRSDGDRLTRFMKIGWEVIGVWNFEIGSHAEEVEKRIFALIRNERKIPVFLSSQDMQIGGHTETMDADSVDILELKDLINVFSKEV